MTHLRLMRTYLRRHEDIAMNDRIEQHLRSAQAAGLSDRTVGDRRIVLHCVDRDLPFGLCEATIEDLEDWLANPKWRPATRATYYGHIAAFFAWAQARGKIDYNPAECLTRPRVPETLPHLPPDAALTDVLSRAPDPWRRYVLIAAYAGLRAAEIAALELRDVTEQIITVRGGKGGKDRAVPTHPDIWQAIRCLPAGLIAAPCPDGRAPDGHWISQRGSEVITRLGYREITMHWWRHWFATSMLNAGVNIRVVQQLMGHSSVATTARYLHTSDRQRQMAISALPILLPASK